MKKIYRIKDFIRYITTIFSKSDLYFGHGTYDPFEEALSLISNVININLTLKNKLLDCYLFNYEIKKIIKRLKLRLINKIPLPYINKKIYYCEYPFYIDKRVVIPRSPLGFFINSKLKKILNFTPNTILDLCTGSGCLGIMCQYIFPTSYIDISDISYSALEVAEINVKIHKLENNIAIIKSNLFKKLKFNFYDLIITNPPYISYKNLLSFPKEYLYEPKIGLIGKYPKKNNKLGLKTILNIIKYSNEYLTFRGILICEIGDNINLKNLFIKYPIIKNNSILLKMDNMIDIMNILIFEKKKLDLISEKI